MNDVLRNLTLAAHCKRQALAALLPAGVAGHLAVIERELRPLAVELLSDAHAPAEPAARSRKIDLEEE